MSHVDIDMEKRGCHGGKKASGRRKNEKNSVGATEKPVAKKKLRKKNEKIFLYEKYLFLRRIGELVNDPKKLYRIFYFRN